MSVLAFLTIVTGGLGAARAEHGRADSDDSSAHELWVCSTRHLSSGGCEDPRFPAVRVRRCVGGRWRSATVEQLTAPTDEHMLHVIYVHGNRIDYGDAIARGRVLQRQLARYSSRPVRILVWSWPSARIPGPLNDVQTKAFRTSIESYYLARFLQRYPHEAHVGLLGYSFGSRIATGALHLMDGGTLDGRALASTEPRAPVRVVMMAAATHDDWLLPSREHGQAPALVEAMLNLYNSCDPALKRYRFVDPCGSPAAMGYKGILAANRLRQRGMWLEQRDVAPIVGKTHDELCYLGCSGVISNIRRFLLWDPLQPDQPTGQVEVAAESAASR